MERHEQFAQALADPLLTVEEAGAQAGYKTRSMYAIKGLYGIDARAAWLRAEKQREIDRKLIVAAQYEDSALLELSLEQGRSVVARIALDKQQTGRTRLAAVALYEQLYRKGEGSARVLTLAEYLSRIGTKDRAQAETREITCEVIQ